MISDYIVRIFDKHPFLYSLYQQSGLKDLKNRTRRLKREIIEKGGLLQFRDFRMLLDGLSFMDLEVYRQYKQTGLYEKDISLYIMKNLNVAGIFEDVGANSGYYSLLASTIVGEKGRVYSFEPDHKTFNRLVRNVELNSMVNVNALNIALSSFDGEGELSVSQTSDGLNSLKPIPLVKQKVKIKVRKLDTVLNGEIDIIKIDAEGSTLDIINGGTNVISLSKGIKIIYELDKNRVTNEKLFNTLNLMGFKSFALKDGNLSTMISKFDDLPKGIDNLVAVRNIGISKSG